MKKLVSFKILIAIITLLNFSIISFSQVKNKYSYIILSGKIENVMMQTNGKRIIEISPPYYLKSEKKKIVYLADDGSFSDTIKSGSGVYYIFDQTNVFPIYLNKSRTYTINYHSANLRNGEVKLGGADTSINRYYIEKYQKRVFVDRLNVGRSEEEFRQLIGKIKQDQLQRLHNSKLPATMKLEEAKFIKYEYLSELYYFLQLKEQNNPAFKPSLISKTELNINYGDEEEYKRQPYYSKLVDLFYTDKMNFLVKKHRKIDPSYSMSQDIIRTIDSLVTNKYIKNDLIKQYARSRLTSAEDKEAYYNDFVKYYTGNDEVFKEEMRDAYLRFTKLQKGTLSPEFYNYPDYSGGKKSLKDFRGKFVYIDIWATWCGNCWRELPFLKKWEEAYSDKNIVFLSLSWDEFESEWKEAIQKYNLSGVQLLANRDDDFFKIYAVSGIPRYIFLDTNGCIIDYNAPMPSESEKIEALFKSVGL